MNTYQNGFENSYCILALKLLVVCEPVNQLHNQWFKQLSGYLTKKFKFIIHLPYKPFQRLTIVKINILSTYFFGDFLKSHTIKKFHILPNFFLPDPVNVSCLLLTVSGVTILWVCTYLIDITGQTQQHRKQLLVQLVHRRQTVLPLYHLSALPDHVDHRAVEELTSRYLHQ